MDHTARKPKVMLDSMADRKPSQLKLSSAALARATPTCVTQMLDGINTLLCLCVHDAHHVGRERDQGADDRQRCARAQDQLGQGHNEGWFKHLLCVSMSGGQI